LGANAEVEKGENCLSEELELTWWIASQSEKLAHFWIDVRHETSSARGWKDPVVRGRESLSAFVRCGLLHLRQNRAQTRHRRILPAQLLFSLDAENGMTWRISRHLINISFLLKFCCLVAVPFQLRAVSVQRSRFPCPCWTAHRVRMVEGASVVSN
jgi:hypothetical protein